MERLFAGTAKKYQFEAQKASLLDWVTPSPPLSKKGPVFSDKKRERALMSAEMYVESIGEDEPEEKCCLLPQLKTENFK